MSAHMEPGGHLLEASEMIRAVDKVMKQGGGDLQTRATAAVAEAVLALTEEVAMLRRDLAADRSASELEGADDLGRGGPPRSGRFSQA
jgi:hypothetical protein